MTRSSMGNEYLELKRWWIALVASIALVAIGCGGQSASSGKGSETNWLSACVEEEDCDEGSCLCGVCTIVCDRDAECGEVEDAVDEDVECVSVEELSCGSARVPSVCAENLSQLQRADGADGGTSAGDLGDAGMAASERDASATSSGAEQDPGDAPPVGATTGSSATDGATKVDVLFVVDNSRGMADKQRVLADAVPDLLERLENPLCIDGAGTTTVAQDGVCPAGSEREFAPVSDIHLGVITSSLGGYGAAYDCGETVEGNADMAHLVASLPRGRAAPSASEGFVSRTAGLSRDAVAREVSQLVLIAGDSGCGWEAPLEAWYRFLVDPFPYTRIVRTPCNDADTQNLCNGPQTDEDGDPLVDQALLEQRSRFLRPDSLLLIVMLSDENDCSFTPNGHSWRLAQTINEDGGFNPAFRAALACSDPAMGPNHECCVSCGEGIVPAGCPTAVDADDRTTPLGCEVGRRYGTDGVEDHPNLRCFQQKRRFGMDLLLPVERYSNALSLPQICPFTLDLAPNARGECSDGTLPVDNPIFVRGSEGEQASSPRPPGRVVLSGILGVPWQDLAVNPDLSAPLVYRSTDPASAERVNWDWILGDPNPPGGIPNPRDAFMREDTAPRSGTNPATGESVQAPDSAAVASPINGHEHANFDQSTLQHACISPLPEPRECPSFEEFNARTEQGEVLPYCECSELGGDAFQNPLCQASDGSYDLTQRYMKALPSLRQLAVMRAVGERSVPGSICPKVADENSPDYGYRPFVSALVSRLGTRLE